MEAPFAWEATIGVPWYTGTQCKGPEMWKTSEEVAFLVNMIIIDHILGLENHGKYIGCRGIILRELESYVRPQTQGVKCWQCDDHPV